MAEISREKAASEFESLDNSEAELADEFDNGARDSGSERMKRLRKKSMRLPMDPGVYIMKNKKGEIIYIGKAKHLKNRVSQYFGSQNNHPVKVRRMVQNVADFDYIVVSSEFESLVLECSLIKQHAPKYNILLKDDKGYSYLKISGDTWKNLTFTHQKLDDGAKYIGPYMSSDNVQKSLEEACKIFRLPTCSMQFPRDIKSARPCLNYYIKQCSAPCAGKITMEEHNKRVDAAVKFITGGSEVALKELNDKMLESSEKLEFEKAAYFRDTINAIKRTREKQVVYSNKIKEQDVFAVAESEDKMCLSVLRFSDGRLYDSEWFIVESIEDLPSARLKFITDYYSIRNCIPGHIAVDGEIESKDILSDWLEKKRGGKTVIYIPERGENAGLTDMAKKNASEKLAQRTGSTAREVRALQELSEILGLKKIPAYIESYDISNTAGEYNVAGMIVFKDGRPLKSAYRRFKIKSFEGQDDYRSMNEVISRRVDEYKKYHDENGSADSDEGFGKKPDLILLDGGKGQVSAVKDVLSSSLMSDVPLFGMVKDSKHRTRAIVATGEELSITDKRAAFTLVSSIQDEVHRYAISYHRLKRSKGMVRKTLTEIPGIGEKRAAALLKKFGSVQKLSLADEDEIRKTDGMTKKTAADVYKYYHPDN